MKPFLLILILFGWFSPTYHVATQPASADTTRASCGTLGSEIRYDRSWQEPRYRLIYDDPDTNLYLARLRHLYRLDTLIARSGSDMETAQRILHWVHSLWKHNGINTPSRPDAISIIEEARRGKQFTCVEYATVATACLNAVGLLARPIALYTADVETRLLSAGHVAVEVYLDDIGKWAFVDPQWDVLPVLDGKPLHAVELQEALLANKKGLQFVSPSGTENERYAEWIKPYLFYMDVAFDNRQTEKGIDLNTSGKTRLMLVPLGAKEPTVFQVYFRIDNCIYTHFLSDFYDTP